MKSSALIVASFAVGAFVFLALSQDKQDASAAPVVEQQVRHSAVVRPSQTLRPKAVVHRSSPPLITIPRLHVRAKVGTNLDVGPAWWPVTGRPGGGDTIAIAGHRTTHTHPFLDLDRLAPGDVILVRWHGLAHRYLVSGRRIVSAKNLHIADARGHELLLLTACTPKGSSRQRIIVYAWPDQAAS